MAVDINDLIDKLPSLNIPGLSSKDSIGIDIGNSSIKIVQLKGSFGNYSLVRWSVIPLIGFDLDKPGKTDLTPEEKNTSATNLLTNYRESSKGIPKNAISSVSGNAVIVRYVKFQKLTRKELSKTIKREAEPYIPFNIDEVYIGFHPLRDLEEEGGQKMETVLVAAKQELVNQRIDILEGAGFKPTVIDVDAFALEAAYESSAQYTPEETLLIANIGYSQTNLVIIDRGVSMVVKDSPVAGNSISKAVMKNLGVDLRSAEKIKMQHGILVSPQEKEAALNEGRKEALGVSNSITSVGKNLVMEMKKLMEFYGMQGSDRQVSRVLITGGSSNIRNLIAYFNKELNMPVEKLNAFTQVSGAEGIPDDFKNSLSVAIGLAMRRPGDLPK